jgi:thymidylate synthase
MIFPTVLLLSGNKYQIPIFSKANGSQFESCVAELKKNPFSRRAIMIYTRPSMQYDYNKNGMSDFMCTNAVQYLIREDKIHAVVQMRSNDVVYGYKNDFAWQEYVLNELADRLDIERGDIHWNVGSLHVYERHFDLVK